MGSKVIRVAEFERAGALAPKANWNAGKRDNVTFRDRGNPGPNSANVNYIDTVRGRVYDAIRNTPLAARAVEILTTNIVGRGIVPRPADPAVRELLREWAHECDADGITDLYGLQEQVVAAWASGGEAFVRMRPRRLTDGLTIPLQLQVLEADMLPLHDLPLSNGNRIVQGIEFNTIGRRVAYWFYQQHPHDLEFLMFARPDLWTRVPAEQVCHIYEPMRPGQIRGFPRLGTVLQRMQAMSDYDEATIERQKQASHITLILRRPAPTSPGIDPITGEAIKDREVSEIAPGSAYSLLPGEDVSAPDLPSPGENYEPFQRVQGRAIAAGAGVPYELLTGDFSGLNDRTSRIVLNEFRRHMEQHQRRRMIHQMCRPIGMAAIEAAVLAGLLPADASRRIPWVPPEWPYLHPEQDVNTLIKEVQAGFRSRRDVVTSRGRDPDEVLAENLQDTREAEASGLTYSTGVSAESDQDANTREAQAARAQAIHDAQMRVHAAQADEHEARKDLSAARALCEHAAARKHEAEAALAAAEASRNAETTAIEKRAAEARMATDAAESAARVASIERERDRLEQESAERVAALQAQLADARETEQQRRDEEARVWAERLRVVALEREAAEVGLRELRGD